ncbi:MAG: pyridoxal-dependent decarboxylase [Reyranella sp.]|nr:pyridoxal-dependent decarboxylase [Reyranella sp.]MDP3158655.1 pyridoxal-dependent decarboxylase [Reyranella sp.]
MSIENYRESFRPLHSSSVEVAHLHELLGQVYGLSAPLTTPSEHVDFELSDENSAPLAEVVEEVGRKVVRYAVNNRHPLAMAHMHPPPSTVSVLGDAVIGALNQCAFIWEEAPAAALIEREVVRWLCRRVGFGEQATGLLTSGGTMSNLLAAYLALTRAREHSHVPSDLCVIASDQAHFSLQKAVSLLGLGQGALVRVETDAQGRLLPGAVREAALRQAGAGRFPFLFVCTAGTTNAGSIEPSEEFVETAALFGGWCHVDAAHGGMLCLSPRHRAAAEAWRTADSISWDPHKSMYVSYAVGALLLRDRDADAALEFHSEYALKDDECLDAGNRHFEGSRRFDALKLWMTIRHFGTSGYAALVDHGIDLSRAFALKLSRCNDFEVLTDPDTNIVCFRYRRGCGDEVDNRVNTETQRSLFRMTGRPLLSSTKVRGSVYLRAVLGNPFLAEKDFDHVIAAVRDEAGKQAAGLGANRECP